MISMKKDNDPAFVQLVSFSKERTTRNQEQVLWALYSTGKLLSAQEIHRILKENEGTRAQGLTTVYRTVETLCQKGYLQCVLLKDGEKRYELLVPGHHHHNLRCDSCQRNTRLDECIVTKTKNRIKEKYGFIVKSHTMEITGICSECAEQAEKNT